MKEVSMGKADSSMDSLNAVGQVGGVAYIPFKSNLVGNPKSEVDCGEMFYYLQMRQEGFMPHYHWKSNVETTNRETS
jgi:hypothetical protein